MRLITLTHANLNQRVEVSAQLVFAFYHSPGNQATHVVASGGAIFPARESVEEIKNLLDETTRVDGTTQSKEQ